MSLLTWLKNSKSEKSFVFETPKVTGLPDPNAEDNIVDAFCESANKEIKSQTTPSTSKGKKRR